MFEIAATVMGLIQGILVWANKRCNWIFYCLQYIFLGIFSFTAHLYGDMTNAVIYFFIGVAGWFLWNESKEEKPIRNCSWHERIIYIAFIAVVTVILYLILRRTDDPLPLLDSLTTSTGYVATFYMLTKKTDTWILWLINDILYVAEYWLLPDQALYLMFLNIIWTFMAVGSLITWYKESKK